MTARYARYTALKFNRPKPRILEVILSKPGKLNALDEAGHRELVEVWRDVDKDPDTAVVLLRGEGGVFSAGGDFAMIERMAADWAVRTRVWKEASDLVYNVINCAKIVVAAIEGPRVGVAAGDHAAIVWPLLCGMAKAKYYLLTCEALSGEEAERIGLVSRAVDDDQVQARALE